ncbi:MAG: hypothetical protein V4440_12190 [Pseudomonadota bacterium]
MLSPLNRLRPVVDKDGKPLQVLQLFSEDVARLATIVGTGSPEGVVEALEAQEYMDRTGLPGAVKYVKQLPDIGGNRKMGWVPI